MRHEEMKKNTTDTTTNRTWGGMKMLFVLSGFSGPRWPSEADQCGAMIRRRWWPGWGLERSVTMSQEMKNSGKMTTPGDDALKLKRRSLDETEGIFWIGMRPPI